MRKLRVKSSEFRVGAALALLLSAFSSQLSAFAAPISDALLDAVALVETQNRNIPGDRGRAAGVYQLHAAAVKDVAERASVQPCLAARWNPAAAREIARRHLESLDARLRRTLARPATIGELYAAWNLGYDGFERRGFRLVACPRHTRRAAAAVATTVAALYERRAWEAESAVIDRRYRELRHATERMLASLAP